MSRLPGLARLGSVFLLGMACALWLFPVLAGPRMQQLRLERDAALGEVESLREEVRRLEESAKQKQGRAVVKHVRVVLDGADERVLVEAERRLQKELSGQVGRPVDEVSYVLLYTRYHGSLMEVDGLLYRLEIRAVAVTAELTLYGTIQPVKAE